VGRHPPASLECRPAVTGDAEALASVYLRSRRELVVCAPLAHSDEEIRAWIGGRLIPAGRTTVALVGGDVVGLLAVSSKPDGSWIDQLYLLPERIGEGIGTVLLERALAELPPPIRLYTFQANARARRFYEARGFEAIAFGDGAHNEERCPDVLYEWRPRS
jgi:GNAT superfamily N-acetyltransferase